MGFQVSSRPTAGRLGNLITLLANLGHPTNVSKAAQGDQWLCHATKTMVPAFRTLQEIRRDFGCLAESLKSEYDGWGTR